MYNTLILLLFAFKLTEGQQLPYCPETVIPNSPHSLTRPIILDVNPRNWKPIAGNIWHDSSYFLIDLQFFLICMNQIMI